MLPYGYSVDLYENDAWSGSKWHADGPYFEDDTLKMTCIDVPDSFSWLTSSLKFYRTPGYGTAKGFWKGYTSTEEIDFDIKEGFHNIQTTEDDTQMEFNLNYDMKVGIKYMNSKISEGYSDEISTDVKSTYHLNYNTTTTIPCNAKDPADGVGLWQWVTESYDGKG